MTELENAIYELSFATGQEFILILTPEDPDQEVYMSRNGKPLSENLSPREVFEVIMGKREKRWKGSISKILGDALDKHTKSVKEIPATKLSKRTSDSNVRKRINRSIEGM